MLAKSAVARGDLARLRLRLAFLRACEKDRFFIVIFELPNLFALNFLLHGALGGGGTVTLRTDAQAKVYSSATLRLVIDVPDAEAKAASLPEYKR